MQTVGNSYTCSLKAFILGVYNLATFVLRETVCQEYTDSTHRTEPMLLDGKCSEIRFQTFHIEINILRCQKIRNAYYNFYMLHGEEKVHAHLCKKGIHSMLEAVKPIHATLQVFLIAFTLP